MKTLTQQVGRFFMRAVQEPHGRSAAFGLAESQGIEPSGFGNHGAHGNLPALPIGNRRYRRLEICATSWPRFKGAKRVKLPAGNLLLSAIAPRPPLSVPPVLGPHKPRPRFAVLAAGVALAMFEFNAEPVLAAAAYVWNQTGSAAWTTAANWTPSRTTTASDDVLVFNNGVNTTATAVPAQTIGKLQVSGNTTVALQASGINTLAIGAQATDALTVANGSQLNVSGSSPLTISLATGAKGSISGSMTFSAAAHRLTAADTSAVTFTSGATFTAGSGFTGNAFGITSLNSVLFASGSTYICKAGYNPFGADQPNSVVVFQTGCLYSHQLDTLAPQMSGRTYANLDINVFTFNLSMTGVNPLTCDDLTIQSATSAGINVTGGVTVRGNITVTSGTLKFDPGSASTLTLGGSSVQTISGAGTLTLGANCNVAVNNPAGVLLNKDVIVNGTLTLTSGIISSSGGNRLAALGSISGGSATAHIATKLAQRWSATGSKTFAIGKGGNYRPLVLNYTVLTGASFVTTEQFESGYPGSYPNVTMFSRYWTVSEIGSSARVYTITLDGTGLSPTHTGVVLKYNSPTTIKYANGGTPPTYQVAGLTSFSDFGLGDECNPPTGGADTMSTPKNTAATISSAKLKANDAGASLHITAVTAGIGANHGSVSISGTDGSITYTPKTDYSGSDTFTYTLSNDQSCTVEVTVTVTVGSGQEASANAVFTGTIDGNFVARFAGIPGYTYTVEYSGSMPPNNSWAKLGNAKAPDASDSHLYGVGVFQVTDLQGSSSRYYRTVWPAY